MLGIKSKRKKANKQMTRLQYIHIQSHLNIQFYWWFKIVQFKCLGIWTHTSSPYILTHEGVSILTWDTVKPIIYSIIGHWLHVPKMPWWRLPLKSCRDFSARVETPCFSNIRWQWDHIWKEYYMQHWSHYLKDVICEIDGVQ